ncbi:MAG: hypothetical protein GY859_11505, partial [Desulfobacterales bacterium]|nr:hypothetical protein [Desulfobacterales bacterium]
MSPELEKIFTYFGIASGIFMAIMAVMRVWASIYPFWKARRDRRILIDKFARGPFDEDAIQRSTRWFIRPRCSNIDPGREKEIRHALTATHGDLFKKVDQFIEEDADIKHLLVLADSGTGKTTFVLNYYAH